MIMDTHNWIIYMYTYNCSYEYPSIMESQKHINPVIMDIHN